MSNRDLFERRLGKFYIPKTLIQDSPNTVLIVLGTIIVIRAEFMWSTDGIEYEGLSKYFEPVPLGQRVPEYECIFEQGRFMGWKRIDN